ncbi:DoxX family protein [Arundinibacter roseus]|uniref:DoxX family protein n=1 Tax=Arundinibacter roseus TaxID=2070510 RepID=A0A4V2X9S0_9BACT|nr:DoxX family protein [Arundinibacter roseus]TDB64455.1 DoxX family protein [Arundinibacter roseus]
MVYIMALLYIAAGSMHFIQPKFFLKIVPPILPFPEGIVIISGIAEILLGLLLLVPFTRALAAWGVILLLIAVFPANLYMAYAPKFHQISPWIRWGRLPLQFVLMYWAYQYTR